MAKNKWIPIKDTKSLPANIHFRNHTEYWMCKNGIVFKGYFYNAYGGKNFSIAEHNDEKIRAIMRANKIDGMGPCGFLDAYMPIERPAPFVKDDSIPF